LVEFGAQAVGAETGAVLLASNRERAGAQGGQLQKIPPVERQVHDLLVINQLAL
jgi:hypothetical protein